MKITLIAVAVLLVIFVIVGSRNQPVSMIATPAGDTPLPPSIVAPEDDDITSPSDTPQQRANQIVMCRELVKRELPQARELTANCRKMLARFDQRAEPNREKALCAGFEKGGGFCYGGKAYTQEETHNLQDACNAVVEAGTFTSAPKDQQKLCARALKVPR